MHHQKIKTTLLYWLADGKLMEKVGEQIQEYTEDFNSDNMDEKTLEYIRENEHENGEWIWDSYSDMESVCEDLYQYIKAVI